MVSAAFLKWDNFHENIALASWNLHGAKNKLHCTVVLHFLRTFDIIFLNEVHSELPLDLITWFFMLSRNW
jgi:hypothetical protein